MSRTKECTVRKLITVQCYADVLRGPPHRPQWPSRAGLSPTQRDQQRPMTLNASQGPRVRRSGPRRSIHRLPRRPILIPCGVYRQTSHGVNRNSRLIHRTEPSERVNDTHSLTTHDQATLLTTSQLSMTSSPIHHSRLNQPSNTTVLSGSLQVNRLSTRKLNRSSTHSNHLPTAEPRPTGAMLRDARPRMQSSTCTGHSQHFGTVNFPKLADAAVFGLHPHAHSTQNETTLCTQPTTHRNHLLHTVSIQTQAVHQYPPLRGVLEPITVTSPGAYRCVC